MKTPARRFTACLGAIFALVGGATVLTTVPANADTGDGNTACNSGEICFYYYYNFGNYSRQFWYDDMNHSNDYFWDIGANRQSSIRLMDNAGSFWNRDTACSVKLWDVDGNGRWFVTYTFPRGWKNNLQVVGKQDRNNGHSRC